MNLFEKLKKISEIPTKHPMRIFLDEQTGQIKEEPLSKFDSAGSAWIHRTMMQYNQAREIHKAMFGS